jgi:microcystin-dependent protein
MTEPFLAEVRMFAGNFAPKGWAFCNGSVLSINQNQALFSLLGTTYGGNGTSTFALPDLRGRTPVHRGTEAQGEFGGSENVTLAASNLPTHTHGMGAASGAATDVSPAGNVWATWSDGQYSNQSPGVTMDAGAVGSAGGGQPHPNRPPYLALSYIIALQGIFPSRN